MNQFTRLISVITTMPHSTFDIRETISSLDSSNKYFKETIDDSYQDKNADINQQLMTAKNTIDEHSIHGLEQAPDNNVEIKNAMLAPSNAKHERDKLFTILDNKHQSTIDFLPNDISHHIDRYNTFNEQFKKYEKSQNGMNKLYNHSSIPLSKNSRTQNPRSRCWK